MAMTPREKHDFQEPLLSSLQHTTHQIYEQVSPTMSWRCGILQEVTRKMQMLELEIRIALLKDK